MSFIKDNPCLFVSLLEASDAAEQLLSQHEKQQQTQTTVWIIWALLPLASQKLNVS